MNAHLQIITGEEIIAVVDMDDWLAHNNVLAKVAKIYQKTNCWITYGNIQRVNAATPDPYGPYPSKVIQNKLFRKYPWRFHSLKTFKGFSPTK